jgi:hypothetical protein
MHTYLIERHIPGAGKLSAAELRAISQQSVGILRDLGPEIRWLHSYVIEDKIYCVYESISTDLIHEHARCMGIPANHVSQIHATISPATATTA